MERQRWNQDRRRKQPSLYDEYLSQERAAHQTTPRRPSIPVERDGRTIRAVTPDSPTGEAIVEPKNTGNLERDFLSSPESPSSSLRSWKGHRESPRMSQKAGRSSVESGANGNQKESSMGTVGHEQTRPRTRTLESTLEGRPQAGRTDKGRLRLGSVHHTGQQHSSSSGQDRPRSRGRGSLPSSISQPIFGSSASSASHFTGSTGPRPTSKSSTAASLSDSVSGPLPSPSARRILHLMKTLCGRMSGGVSFRRGRENPWTATYCYIREDTGALMSESDIDVGLHRTLIPDLRGCHVRCLMEESTQTPYLEVGINTILEVHLKLASQSDLDSWFAAILCWQPIRPKGIQNKVAKSQASLPAPRPIMSDNRQVSEISLLKEAPVIKVGKMIFWNTNISFGSANVSAPTKGVRPQPVRMQSHGTQWWRRVSCTLRENGELKLYAESDNSLISVVQLSQLSRCAIQRLDPSVLESDFCIAIYPRYTSDLSMSSPLRPIFLSVDTRILYEVWFVLLRAFTIPQLYGPKPPDPIDYDDTSNPQKYEALLSTSNIDMFRMERSLSIRIVEAKLQPGSAANGLPSKPEASGGHYVEVHLDGETRAKTLIKTEGSSPFWRQDFDYYDLPAVLTSASVLLKYRQPESTSSRSQSELRQVQEAYGVTKRDQSTNATSGYTGTSNDMLMGKVEIFLEELEGRKEIEKWWPVINSYEERVGEILIKARAEENVILMLRDYEPLSRLLHKFENGVTVQIASAIPPQLKRLSDLLLNIFQVSGQATNWLTALVEDEIDGLGKETPMSRLRYSRRMGSVDSEGTPGKFNDRELVVRDLNKNAMLEANLLFRGNTLLTRSLDTHMRRIGPEYLAATLGAVVKSINDKDPDCEVDPNKVVNANELQRNWSRLLTFTQEVWLAIERSVQLCPVDLRTIFRHIRACAEDRYGDFLRSVSYSSVSGFLFLRFFCPAVLNPKLFGLLKDDPKPRARRTFTLIAKSLQGLANMASFGSKEHWMEPMNAFLNSHREAFKSFVEDVCFVPDSPSATPETHPSYLTPQAIKGRLPLTSREGFPSLPYLLDEAREFAGLVDLWLKSSSKQDLNNGMSSGPAAENGALRNFHDLCAGLHERTQECLSRAERAERPTSDLSFRWEELIESLQGSGISDTLPVVPSSEDEDPLTPAPGRSSLDDMTATPGTLRQRPDLEASPGRHIAERAWGNDRDGGAASATASLLSQERNTRSGFVLTGSNSAFDGTGSRFNHMAAAATPAQQQLFGAFDGDSPRARFGTETPDRPASALSGSVLSSDTEPTALPSVSSERSRREQWAREEKKRTKQQRERDKDKVRVKDLVPGLGRRKKEREK